MHGCLLATDAGGEGFVCDTTIVALLLDLYGPGTDEMTGAPLEEVRLTVRAEGASGVDQFLFEGTRPPIERTDEPMLEGEASLFFTGEDVWQWAEVACGALGPPPGDQRILEVTVQWDFDPSVRLTRRIPIDPRPPDFNFGAL